MAETLRPILAVDVDGVLNAMSGGPRPPRGWQDAGVLGFRIRYNPGHGAQLLAIARETGAELTWCTTWEDTANKHIAPLIGLPGLPWVSMDPGRSAAVSASPDGGKQPGTHYHSVGTVKAAAMAIYAGQQPFCWLEDEPDAGPALASCPVPHLVIRVDPRAGLQDFHLQRAHAWLLDHAEHRGEAGRG